MPEIAAGRCKQAGCKGAIEDGYCSVCGLAGPRASTPTSSPEPPINIAATGAEAGTVRRTARTSSKALRTRLGASLISIPELPTVDPETAVLPDPKVPDSKRFCANCDRQLVREKGFCGQCGQRYSFVPTLRPGELLASQYEVRGAIAYGGLGWIYLAFDRLLSRYVVLKGLLNAEDSEAAAIAVAERRFLAAVKHPNIVGVYNFVQSGTEGFTVMEYVGGKTLRDLRRSRGPLPPSEAIAYVHRILNAFAYLHRMKLVYCDFKPENVMVELDDVKLIDLGGVRRIDDLKGNIYGTVGYSAPEAGDGPTVESDLFTVGRTLAVLVAEIRGFTNNYRFTLPGPEQEPLFASQESLYRFLLKATAARPGDRFSSAEEMAEQLLGVLHEQVAKETGEPRPANSTLFSGDMLPFARSSGLAPVLPDYRHLPVPMLDPGDPAFPTVMNAIALPGAEKRVAALRLASEETPESLEAAIRLSANLADIGFFDDAERVLEPFERSHGWDWRVKWFRARLFLAQNSARSAQSVFDEIYSELPGELAPKLALGLAAELAGDDAVATRMYDIVSRTDPNFYSACFGLARRLAAAGDRRGSVEALGCIPAVSSMHACARLEAARTLLIRSDSGPTIEDLGAAAAAVDELSMEGVERYRLIQQILEAALPLVVGRKRGIAPDARLFGKPLREPYVRQALEQCLRSRARLTRGDEKIRLIDQANRVRPRSLL